MARRLSGVLGGELRTARRAAGGVAGRIGPTASDGCRRGKEHVMTETKITAGPGSNEIRTEREFEAPRDLVFRAYTEPDLLVQWLGPRRYTMEIDRYEARDGGRYRYVHRDEDGNEHGFRGVFHGDPSPDQMVQTFEW